MAYLGSMKSLKSATFLLLVLGLLGMTSCTRQTSSPQGPAKARGSIVFVEGEVRVDGVAAEVGQALGPKASIETGPASTCDIVFDGRNAVRIAPNSLALLDFSRLVKEIDLKKGGMSAVLKKLEKLADKDSFKVIAPTATAGVRGTSFCVWTDETTSYVCACNGTVRTVDSNGSNDEVLSSAHHVARLYTRTGGSITKVPAGVAHHDDAGVQSVADRIGYTVDWTKID